MLRREHGRSPRVTNSARAPRHHGPKAVDQITALFGGKSLWAFALCVGVQTAAFAEHAPPIPAEVLQANEMGGPAPALPRQDSDCWPPKRRQLEERDATWEGLSFDTSFEYRFEHTALRMPLGYQTRPTPRRYTKVYVDENNQEHLTNIYVATRADISFMHPDLAFPRVRDSRYRWRCGDRSRSRVRAVTMRPFERKSDGYISPARAWRNAYQVFDGTAFDANLLPDGIVVHRVLGLQQAYLRGALTEPFVSVDYFGPPEDTREVFFQCDGPLHPAPIHLCVGRIYWPEDALGVRIWFLQDVFSDWEMIIENTRSLLLHWRQNAAPL